MFEQRSNNFGINFTQYHDPGSPLKNGVMGGDTVTLRIDEERVLVLVIKPVGNSKFKGRVLGFEPSGGLQFKQLKVDEEIEFNELNIFSCAST